ncbi:MAG: hypothetical protein GXX96_01645 [Planctomycetaceae bacterium]|nr:hypothetical protein [Planctomycetaceae bacterium]
MVRSQTVLALAVSLVWLGLDVSSAEARSDRVKGALPFESSAETVDLFKAVEQGVLSVKVIPRDSKECRILITNETAQPVNVQMPFALAAVPVLAQVFADGLDQSQNNRSTPQRLGIGNPFGQQNPLQMGQNMQGGPLMNPGNQPFFAPFCIPPEKVAQLRLPAVCLDYGQPTPRPAMRYRLVAMAEIGEPKELEVLCRQLGLEPSGQQVAQAAAWHLADGKTWDEMEEMVIRRLGQPDQPFFKSKEIEAAKSVVGTLKAAVVSNDVQPPASVASVQ